MEEKKKELGIVKAVSDLMLIPLTKENVRRFICDKATDDEIALFLNQCAIYGLNPFKREIYLVKYSANDPASIVVSYEVYLKRAEESKKWAGLETGVTRDKDGKILTAWAKVYRKDWGDRPLSHEIQFSEYVALKKEVIWIDGVRKETGNMIPTKFWKDKPETMAKKVAVAQSFRMAFPEKVGRLPYIEEEINRRADEGGPTLLDIATAAGVKVEGVEKKPLGNVEDEFTNPEKFPAANGGEKKTEPHLEPPAIIIKGLADKIKEIKASGVYSDETIYIGINASLRKAKFPEIGELRDLNAEGVVHVAGYLDLWIADIKTKKEKKDGTKKV